MLDRRRKSRDKYVPGPTATKRISDLPKRAVVEIGEKILKREVSKHFKNFEIEHLELNSEGGVRIVANVNTEYSASTGAVKSGASFVAGNVTGALALVTVNVLRNFNIAPWDPGMDDMVSNVILVGVFAGVLRFITNYLKNKDNV